MNSLRLRVFTHSFLNLLNSRAILRLLLEDDMPKKRFERSGRVDKHHRRISTFTLNELIKSHQKESKYGHYLQKDQCY